MAFLQADSTGIVQVYAADVVSHERTRLTDDRAAVLSFAASPHDDILYATRLPDPDSTPHRFDEAIVVKTSPLVSLANRFPELDPEGYTGDHAPPIAVRLRHTNGNTTTVYTVHAKAPPVMVMAPVGGKALLQLAATDTDYARWRGYTGHVRELVDGKLDLSKFVVVDVASGASRLLLDAPSFSPQRVVWSPTGQSVVVQTWLPLDAPNSTEPERRGDQGNVLVEVDVSTGRVAGRVLTHDPKRPEDVIVRNVRGWDQHTNALVVSEQSLFVGSPVLHAYRKRHGSWVSDDVIDPGKLVAGPTGGHTYMVGAVSFSGDLLAARVENGTRSPEVMLVNRGTQHRQVITDLNPDLKRLQFGAVRDFTWRDTSGREWVGGLVLPPGYVSGKRYPLVLQTHGYNPGEFLMDGPGELTSAFAAQPLASRGIVVLQVGAPVHNPNEFGETNRGAEIARIGLEGAIDTLDRTGLIDRRKVGLIGFSATGWLAGYFATHSSYPLAALTTADNIDFSYWQYVENAFWAGHEFEAALGGHPWGSTFDTVRRNSVGFNLDKATAPWRIETYGGAWAVVGAMETFGMLRAMGKPVDYVWIPNGVHQLAKPRERAASMEGNVDWYDFWLNGHEDPDPAKRDQYIRWGAMKMKGAH